MHFFASSPTEESNVAPVPSYSPSPLTSAESEVHKVCSTALLENENARQKVEDDSIDDDGGSNDDVVVEKIEVNGKEEAAPKKKTRRGKRKPKSSNSSEDKVHRLAN